MTREVHLSDEFLISAIREFRAERGPNGEPSVQDFLDIDLESIKFTLSELWDVLDHWQSHSLYRHRYVQGKVAYLYYVIGRELSDGSIELLELEVDHDRPTP